MRTLVATDIAARGIHVDDIELVVHADPPAEHKAYVHRSGRTARAGKAGTVVTLMTDEQVRDVRALTRAAGIKPTMTVVDTISHPVLQQLAAGERVFETIVVTPAPDTSGRSSGRGNGGGGGGRRSGGRSRSAGRRNGSAQRRFGRTELRRFLGRPGLGSWASSGPRRESQPRGHRLGLEPQRQQLQPSGSHALTCEARLTSLATPTARVLQHPGSRPSHSREKADAAATWSGLIDTPV